MNRANRLLWAAIGVVLLLAGVAAILAGRGRLFGVDPHRVLLDPRAGETWNRWGAWAPIVAIAAGVVLAGLGLWLLRAELRIHERPSLPDIALRPTQPADDRAGRAGHERHGAVGGQTRIETAVLARAMRRDLQSDPRINRAHVRISGRPGRPEVSLRLEIDQDTELVRVHERVNRALDRLAATMPGTPIIDEVLVSAGRATGRRVR